MYLQTEFKLTPLEIERAEIFINKHRALHDQMLHRPHFSFKFVPNGIGCGVSIECCECYETEDITDYGSW